MADQASTGIPNADEIITLALAYGLNVTVETKQRDTLTSHTVRICIPVPVAYAGTELGRTIAADSVTMLWTKGTSKGARGRLEDATAWSATDSRKVRTLRLATARVETMGRDSNRYARETAPLPEDVIDAPHALYIDGELRREGLPAAHVRTIVKNRRFRGWLVHQDDENAICSDDRRFVPVQPAPAEDAPADERKHVRIINGGTPEIIDTRAALHEINTAMMQPGTRAVREMSAARSTAHIAYKNPERGTVELRPATAEDLASGTSVRDATAPDALAEQAHATPQAEPDRDALHAVLRATVDLLAQDAQAQAGVPLSMIDYLIGQAVEKVRGTTETEWVRILRENGREAADTWGRANEELIRSVAALLIPDGARSRPLTAAQARTIAEGFASAVRPAAEVLAADPIPVTTASVQANSDRIRAQASREAYAWGVRHEAQQLGTNQVIEERARESLAAVMHEEAGAGKAGFVFRINPRGAWLRGVTSEGDDWPLLTEALRLHLEHYGWLTETSRSFGVSIIPPGDAGALVMEGQRRSVATAHGQALSEHAQR
ncbi:hypothetical protein ACW4TU_41510 [Streptomyces sp. QTS52]